MDMDDLQEIRRTVAALVSRNGVARARNLRAAHPAFDRAMWANMAQQGLLGIRAPETCGGLQAGLSAASCIAQELARELAPEPFVATAVQAVDVLMACDDSKAASAHLNAIVAGTLVLAVGGGDTISARRVAAGWQLSGQTAHLFPGEGADRILVLAATGETPVIASIPATMPGLSKQSFRNADGTWSAQITLEDALVTDDDILAVGETALIAFARGRIAATLMTAAELCAVMDRALEMTLDYLKTRIQFGVPIGSFQALQHRAVDLFIQKELALSALSDAIATVEGEADPQIVAMEAARAKARATHAGLLIGRESIKLHGAIGVTDECDIGLYLRRALVLAARHGNAAEQRASYGRAMQARGGGLAEREDDLPPAPAAFMAETQLELDWNQFPDMEFRAGIRAYFDTHYPAHLRNLGRRGTPDEMDEWMQRMVRKGWIAPAWPKAHGGMNLSPAKQVIFIEERERAGIARNPDQGVVMFGPMLMRFGTPEQIARFLPGILRNKIIFCQGYSEPNAGSDLASLRSEARQDADGFVLNGSKIWTTMAHHATHMFLLARTDKAVRKQAGISFFILDLKSPGVTIRPIRNIAGEAEFCEVFFDDVRIPSENLVGELNSGWMIAKSLLGFERLNNGSPRRVQGPLRNVAALAAARGLQDDPLHLARYTEIYLDIADLKSAYARFADIIAEGHQPGPEISMLKIWAGECAQKLSEYLIELAGPDGAIQGKRPFDAAQIDILAPFYAMFPAQIASGSSDIQRNILAVRVLGLPRDKAG